MLPSCYLLGHEAFNVFDSFSELETDINDNLKWLQFTKLAMPQKMTLDNAVHWTVFYL